MAGGCDALGAARNGPRCHGDIAFFGGGGWSSAHGFSRSKWCGDRQGDVETGACDAVGAAQDGSQSQLLVALCNRGIASSVRSLLE